jgi:hypothetical protein
VGDDEKSFSYPRTAGRDVEEEIGVRVKQAEKVLKCRNCHAIVCRAIIGPNATIIHKPRTPKFNDSIRRQRQALKRRLACITSHLSLARMLRHAIITIIEGTHTRAHAEGGIMCSCMEMMVVVGVCD